MALDTWRLVTLSSGLSSCCPDWAWSTLGRDDEVDRAAALQCRRGEAFLLVGEEEQLVLVLAGAAAEEGAVRGSVDVLELDGRRVHTTLRWDTQITAQGPPADSLLGILAGVVRGVAGGGGRRQSRDALRRVDQGDELQVQPGSVADGAARDSARWRERERAAVAREGGRSGLELGGG